MAEEAKGQDRLDKITQLIASTGNEKFASLYLLRDPETLEYAQLKALKLARFTKLE